LFFSDILQIPAGGIQSLNGCIWNPPPPGTPNPPGYGPARNRDKQVVQVGTVNTAVQYLHLLSDATNRTCIHQYPNSIIMYASQVPYLYHPCSSFSAPKKISSPKLCMYASSPQPRPHIRHTFTSQIFLSTAHNFHFQHSYSTEYGIRGWHTKLTLVE